MFMPVSRIGAVYQYYSFINGMAYRNPIMRGALGGLWPDASEIACIIYSNSCKWLHGDFCQCQWNRKSNKNAGDRFVTLRARKSLIVLYDDKS